MATAFALQANAATARDNEEAAKQEQAATVAARNDLEPAHTELIRSQEALLKSTDTQLTSVPRSLLRPLLQIQSNRAQSPLSDPEIGAVWERASSKEDRLRLRFVEEALREPDTTRQLKDRAAVALQAVVGLDGMRQKQVEHLLGESL